MGKRTPVKKKNNGAIWWVAGIAVVAVAGLIGLSQMANKKPEPEVTPVADVKTDADLKAEGNRMGPANAKVKVLEYGDYL
jgi:hypothetical protein